MYPRASMFASYALAAGHLYVGAMKVFIAISTSST
jgi:hypothetical protein